MIVNICYLDDFDDDLYFENELKVYIFFYSLYLGTMPIGNQLRGSIQILRTKYVTFEMSRIKSKWTPNLNLKDQISFENLTSK